MRSRPSQFRFRQSLLPIAVVVLWGCYLGILLPMERQRKELQTPLDEEWHHLAGALGQSNALVLNFSEIQGQLDRTVKTMELLETTTRQARARVAPSPELQQRIAAPFQLVDYQIERGRCMERVTRLAKQEKVKIETAVLMGFPEHTADVQSPEILWPALAMTEQMLTCAIHAQISSLRALRFQPLSVERDKPVQLPAVTEIVADIELTGDASKILSFMAAMPLRAEEIQSDGLPDAGPDKAALFIDRFVLKKRAPGKPDEADALIRISSFVFEE